MNDHASVVYISESDTPLHPLYSSVSPVPNRIWIEGTAEARGLLERLPEDGLAVVGTRSPDPRAIFFTQNVITKLRETNLIVISGLARGIDTYAHGAALAAGLPTIAVLGCGIRRNYPAENLRLRKRILAAGGLVLSEFDPDHEPHPSFFVQRNRMISGFSRATWIVQSGYRSGALNTAGWAKKQDKTVYVTPCFPGDPAFLGNQSLLDDHATAVWSAESFVGTWKLLFSAIEKNRRATQTNGKLDLLFEIERGYRAGKELFEILEERTHRTGESIEALLGEIEKTAHL